MKYLNKARALPAGANTLGGNDDMYIGVPDMDINVADQ